MSKNFVIKQEDRDRIVNMGMTTPWKIVCDLEKISRKTFYRILAEKQVDLVERRRLFREQRLALKERAEIDRLARLKERLASIPNTSPVKQRPKAEYSNVRPWAQ